MRTKAYRIPALVLVLFLLGFLVLPNVFNSRERKAFSDDVRLDEARARYHVDRVGDSVEVVPGEFYRRGWIIQGLLGSAYRDLWQQKIKVPVIKLSETGLSPVEFSGGMQTIGIRARDTAGGLWSVRSVNKDQSAALPAFLRPTILRPMFRDQACSLNPYGSLAVAKLAPAIEIHHGNPQLYFVPYDPSLGKYNSRMAGRLVTLMKYVDEGEGVKKDSLSVLETEDMLHLLNKKEASIDTSLYLRSRLFDMLISDWDRHEGNWKWLLRKQDNKAVIEPLPVDRDMAFYRFGDGVVNWIALAFVNTFQSFTPDYNNVSGLVEQAEHLDNRILRHMQKEEFAKQAAFIQQRLNDELISNAFKAYPASAYRLVGQEHEQTLKERLKRLPEVAEQYYELIQEFRD